MGEEAAVTIGGITITSTTEDQAALDTVLSGSALPVPETPGVAETPAEQVPAPTDAVGPTPPVVETPDPTPPSQETPEQYSRRVQDRINGMAATSNAQDRRIKELERELAIAQEVPTAIEPAVPPNPADYQDDADGYYTALASTSGTNAANAALTADREQTRTAREAGKEEQAQENWDMAVREMRANHSDYDALTQQAATTETLGQDALNQVISHLAETPDGAEILHHVLSEPGALTSLGRMSHLERVGAFAVRAHQMATAPVVPAPSPASVVAPVAAPMAPVRPGAAAPAKSPDDMTPSEYNAWADRNNIRPG